MHILIVDDMPEVKVKGAMDFLQANKIRFSYNICKSVNSALSFLLNNKHKIDLLILDLGLPTFEYDNNFENYCQYGGLKIINEMCRKNIFNIPIIINSTTKLEGLNNKIPKELYSRFLISHFDKLDGERLLEFIKTNLNEKIETI